jgi:hypothetical protein
MMSVGGQLKVTPLFGVQLLFYKKYFYKISIRCGPCGTFIRFQHRSGQISSIFRRKDDFK